MSDLFFITLNLEFSFNFSSMESITCPERMNLVIYFSCHLAVLKVHICVEWDFQLWTICLCYLLASVCCWKSCLAACKLGTSLWWIFYHPCPRLLDMIYLYDWSLSVRSESHYDGYCTILGLAYWMWSTYMIGRCLYVRNLTMMDILRSFAFPIGCDLPIWLVAVCMLGTHYDGYFTIFCLSYWMWSTYMIGRYQYVRNLTMMDILRSFAFPIGCDLPIWLVAVCMLGTSLWWIFYHLLSLLLDVIYLYGWYLMAHFVLYTRFLRQCHLYWGPPREILQGGTRLLSKLRMWGPINLKDSLYIYIYAI
jgi:hypothetical protein